MTKNITLMGASYSDVPGVELPQTGGGTAYFTDVSPTTATATDVASGKVFFLADGTQATGSASSGGSIVITDTTDTHGGTIRTITGTVISGTKSITANGTGIDVTSYAAVDVAVPQLDTSDANAAATDIRSGKSGYVNGSKVNGSLTSRDSTSLSASGDTVTVPAGIYDTQVTKSVAAGTAGTPTATKGTVSNHSVSVTPSVTNTTGYITGSTKTGTAVSVSASELVSGNKEITANGTNIDVANYSTVSVAVPSSGSSKNTQIVQGTTRTNASSLTAIGSELTVSKTGTYDIYYSCMRTNTSSSYTWGTRLYIDGTAYGTENTTWSNNVQNTHLTNVSLTVNQKLRVYGRNTRGTSYYVYAPMIAIVEA